MANNKTDININLKNAIAALNTRQQAAGMQLQKQPIQQKALNTNQINLKDIINQFTQLKQTINTANTTNNNTLAKLLKNLQALIDIEKQNQSTLTKILSKSNNSENNQQDKKSSFDLKNFLEHIKNLFESLKNSLLEFKTSILQELTKEKQENTNIDISNITASILQTKDALSDKLSQLLDNNKTNIDNDNISKILSLIKISTNNEQNNIDISPILDKLLLIKTNLSNNNNITLAEKLNILIQNSQNNILTKEDFDNSINNIITVLSQNTTSLALPYAVNIDITNIENSTNNFINLLNQSNLQFLTDLRQELISVLSLPKLQETSKFDYTLLNTMQLDLATIQSDLTTFINANNENDNANIDNNISKNSISINLALKELEKLNQIIENTQNALQLIVQNLNLQLPELNIDESNNLNNNINLIFNKNNENNEAEKFDFNSLLNDFSLLSKNIYDFVTSSPEQQNTILNNELQEFNNDILQELELPETIGINGYLLYNDNILLSPEQQILLNENEFQEDNNIIYAGQSPILYNLQLNDTQSNLSYFLILTLMMQSMHNILLSLNEFLNNNINENINVQEILPAGIYSNDNSIISKEFNNIALQENENNIQFSPEQIIDQIFGNITYTPTAIPSPLSFTSFLGLNEELPLTFTDFLGLNEELPLTFTDFLGLNEELPLTFTSNNNDFNANYFEQEEYLNPLNMSMLIDMSLQPDIDYNVPEIPEIANIEMPIVNQQMPDLLYLQLDFIQKGQGLLLSINSTINNIAEEIESYSLLIDDQSQNISDIMLDMDLLQNLVRLLLNDSAFFALCESSNILDIIQAIALCDEEYNRLNQLKSTNPNLNDIIVLLQKNINQIKSQLLIQKANILNKNSAQLRADELNNRLLQTQSIIDTAKKQTGLTDKQILQKISEKTEDEYFLLLLNNTYSDLSDEEYNAIDTEAPLPLLQLQLLKNSDQIVAEAMSRFTDVHSDNLLVKGYFDSYINSRLNDMFLQIPNISLNLINSLIVRFGNEFENYWGAGQILIPSEDGKTFSPVEKSEIEEKTLLPKPFNLDNIPIVSSLKSGLELGSKIAENAIGNIVLFGKNLFSNDEKLQLPLPEAETSDIMYFDSESYNEDMYNYHVNYALYMDKKLLLALDVDSWKESGSDDITNYFADIKNSFVPTQVQNMLIGNENQYSEILKMNMYQEAANMWDENFNNDVILMANPDTKEIEMYDKNILLLNLQKSLRENLVLPEMPIAADYMITTPLNTLNLNNLELHNEINLEGNLYDEYGLIILPPLDETGFELDVDHLSPDLNIYNQNYIENEEDLLHFEANTDNVDYIDDLSDNDIDYINLDLETIFNLPNKSNTFDDLLLDNLNNYSTYENDNSFYNYETSENYNPVKSESNSLFNNFTTLYNNSKNYLTDFIKNGPDIIDTSVNPLLDGFNNATELEELENQNDIKNREMKISLTNSIISTINNTSSKISENSPNILFPDNTDKLLEGIAQIVSANKPEVIYIWPSLKNDSPKINTYINV